MGKAKSGNLFGDRRHDNARSGNPQVRSTGHYADTELIFTDSTVVLISLFR